MKIMTVITGMNTGGAERVMATLCNELSKRHDVCLLVLKDAQSDYYISNRVEVVSGNITNQNICKCIRVIKKEILRWKPDVILSFMTKTNIVVLLAAIEAHLRDRVIIAERANPYNAKHIFRIIRRVLYPFAAGAVFQTRQAQDYYKCMLKCESVVLRNPLNPDFDIRTYEGERKKTIVTIGRLSIEKNQKMLIKAFERIADKYPDYSVEIYGDGPLQGELQKQIDASGLNNRITLAGRKDNIQEYVNNAGIFVLPSNSEGMPNALLEAMAMGIPSIATDCPIGGTAAIIKNLENGIIIPMNDTVKLADSISMLIDDKALAKRIGHNAQHVTEDYSAEKVCLEWEAYLNKVGKNTSF